MAMNYEGNNPPRDKTKEEIRPKKQCLALRTKPYNTEKINGKCNNSNPAIPRPPEKLPYLPISRIDFTIDEQDGIREIKPQKHITHYLPH
jgi:hypothetical protein